MGIGRYQVAASFWSSPPTWQFDPGLVIWSGTDSVSDRCFSHTALLRRTSPFCQFAKCQRNCKALPPCHQVWLQWMIGWLFAIYCHFFTYFPTLLGNENTKKNMFGMGWNHPPDESLFVWFPCRCLHVLVKIWKPNILDSRIVSAIVCTPNSSSRRLGLEILTFGYTPGNCQLNREDDDKLSDSGCPIFRHTH
jgi:hypothetical protein